jgi:hypothetical protein
LKAATFSLKAATLASTAVGTCGDPRAWRGVSLRQRV